MSEWLIGLGIASGVMVASWLLLIVLARRLPEGTAKELARFLPACVTTVRRLRATPTCPGGQARGRLRRVVGALAGRPDPGVPPGDRPARRRGRRGSGVPLRGPPDPPRGPAGRLARRPPDRRATARPGPAYCGGLEPGRRLPERVEAHALRMGRLCCRASACRCRVAPVPGQRRPVPDQCTEDAPPPPGRTVPPPHMLAKSVPSWNSTRPAETGASPAHATTASMGRGRSVSAVRTDSTTDGYTEPGPKTRRAAGASCPRHPRRRRQPCARPRGRPPAGPDRRSRRPGGSRPDRGVAGRLQAVGKVRGPVVRVELPLEGAGGARDSAATTSSASASVNRSTPTEGPGSVGADRPGHAAVDLDPHARAGHRVAAQLLVEGRQHTRLIHCGIEHSGRAGANELSDALGRGGSSEPVRPRTRTVLGPRVNGRRWVQAAAFDS